MVVIVRIHLSYKDRTVGGVGDVVSDKSWVVTHRDNFITRYSEETDFGIESHIRFQVFYRKF